MRFCHCDWYSRWEAQCCPLGWLWFTVSLGNCGVLGFSEWIEYPQDSSQRPCTGQYREKEGKSCGSCTDGTEGSVRPSIRQEGYILCLLPMIYTCPVICQQTAVSTSHAPGAVWGVRASKINNIWCLFPRGRLRKVLRIITCISLFATPTLHINGWVSQD